MMVVKGLRIEIQDWGGPREDDEICFFVCLFFSLNPKKNLSRREYYSMFSAVVFIITSYIVYEVDVLARPRIYYQKGVVARMKRSRRVAQGLPIVCGMWKLSSTTAGYVKAGLNPRFIHCLTYAASHWFNELDSTLKTPHLQKFFKIHHHFGNFSALYSHLCSSETVHFEHQFWNWKVS